MSAEFDRLVTEFEKFQAQITHIDDRLADAGAMRSDLAAIAATATSDDRSITVVTGPGGSVTDIQLTDEALKQRPQALASALLSTLRTAVARAASTQAGIVEEHMGGDTHLVDQVLSAQAEAFNTTVDQLRADMPERTTNHAAEARAPEEQFAQEFSQQSFVHADSSTTNSSPPAGQPASSEGDDYVPNLFDEGDR